MFISLDFVIVDTTRREVWKRVNLRNGVGHKLVWNLMDMLSLRKKIQSSNPIRATPALSETYAMHWASDTLAKRTNPSSSGRGFLAEQAHMLSPKPSRVVHLMEPKHLAICLAKRTHALGPNTSLCEL